MKVAQLLAIAIVAANGLAAQAGDIQYPKTVYDATYDLKSTAGASTMRMVSNGKGQMRTENKGASYSMASITDYPGHVVYTIMDAQKMVMKTPLAQSYKDTSADSLKTKKGAQDLGVKNIAGHPSHGWKYTENGTTSEVWIDEKAQIVTRSNTTSPSGNSTMEIKSLSTAAPPDSLFKPPSGYKMQ